MKSKRIGIDCRMIKESGIGRYIENILINLNEIDNKNEYFLFVYDKNKFDYSFNKNFKIIPAPFKWHGFEEQFKLLKLINSYKLDIFHSPHPNMPYLYFGDFVITIHDLTMLKEKTGRASTYSYPIYFLKWLVFKIMLTVTVYRAKKIITVSNFVKEQISSEFGVNENKIEVIYNGVSDSIKKVADNEIKIRVLEKFKVKKPFLYYIGNAYPHKNIEKLILAFELFNSEGKYQLFLGGKEDYFYKRLGKNYSKLNNVIFGGYLTDEESSAMYSSCEAFIYPSISEGFGIQIIEALKVGCSVICSNNSSFPEIAGKFAYYFNPYEVSDISKSIEIGLRSPKKIDKELLSEHLKKFNWKFSAQRHYDIYQKS